MDKMLTKLTQEQRDRMRPYAEQWIARGWCTDPLTDDEWRRWESGVRGCYEYAGIPWPGVVVRVGSPIVGAFAAPIAAFIISRFNNFIAVDGAARDAARVAVNAAVHGAVDGAVDAAVDGAVHGAVHVAVTGAVDGAVDAAVDGAVDDAVRAAVDDAVDGAVDDAVHGAVADAVDAAVHGTVDGAVADAVDGAVDAAVDGAVHVAVHGAVHDAVHAAVDDAVDDAVRAAVHNAVADAVHAAVNGAVHVAVNGAVHGTVDGAVDAAVDAAVHAAVNGAVRAAVTGAVKDAIRTAIERLWHHRFSGTTGSWWQSYLGYFRDVIELPLDDEMWDRSRVFDSAQSAGWWWPFEDFVIVCDRPNSLHIERVGPPGWGSHRLHCGTGPAVAWADGWGVYVWHGVRVPADLIEHGWDTQRIMTEPNAEIRRCAIEKMGWDRFIVEAKLQMIAESPDPGNAPHTISLWELPQSLHDMYTESARILLCTNGTEERDGTRRRYGLMVPGHHDDPVKAAAELYGWPVEQYRELEIRT